MLQNNHIVVNLTAKLPFQSYNIHVFNDITETIDGEGGEEGITRTPLTVVKLTTLLVHYTYNWVPRNFTAWRERKIRENSI